MPPSERATTDHPETAKVSQATSVNTQELITPNPTSQQVMPPSDGSTESHFPFLALPAEMRNAIYSALLSNRTIKLVASQPQESASDSGLEESLACEDTNSDIYHQPTGRRIADGPLSISLLLVCLQIHNEARLFPYNNTFQLQHSVLLPFLTARTPHQIYPIHSLTLAVSMDKVEQDAFVAKCFRTAAMKLTGLENLNIDMTVNRPILRLGGRALWANAMGAWAKRDLKEGKVTIRLSETVEVTDVLRLRIKKLEERLSAGMMVKRTKAADPA